MKKIFFIYFGSFLFIVSLSGCKDRHLYTTTKQTIDTITIFKETMRDSIVIVPVDSSSIFALLDCDSLNNVYIKQINDLQGQRSVISMSAMPVLNGFAIQADCICDSISIYLTMKDRFKDRVIKSDTTTEKLKPIPCKKTHFFIYGFILGVIITILFRFVIKIILKLY